MIHTDDPPTIAMRESDELIDQLEANRDPGDETDCEDES